MDMRWRYAHGVRRTLSSYRIVYGMLVRLAEPRGRLLFQNFTKKSCLRDKISATKYANFSPFLALLVVCFRWFYQKCYAE